MDSDDKLLAILGVAFFVFMLAVAYVMHRETQAHIAQGHCQYGQTWQVCK